METNEIKIVIGSWGSYNACNERSLGSTWLDLSNYETYDEIEEELKRQGFILNGIDEELFIQDIEGLDCNGLNCDYTHPKDLFETLKQSGVLDDDYKFETMQAFLEIESFEEFKRRVNENGDDWDENIYLYRNQSWYDLGYDLLHECYEIPEYIDNYVDYQRFGEELAFDGYQEYSNGIIEIR